MTRVTNLVDFAGMLVFDKWTCNTDGRQVVFVRVAPHIYNVVMIDNGFCFNAAEWNFPDAPLRALYALPYAYEAVLGIHTFEPWLQLLETKIDKQWLAEAAEEIPREWYAQATNPLAALLDTLEVGAPRSESCCDLPALDLLSIFGIGRVAHPSIPPQRTHRVSSGWPMSHLAGGAPFHTTSPYALDFPGGGVTPLSKPPRSTHWMFRVPACRRQGPSFALLFPAKDRALGAPASTNTPKQIPKIISGMRRARP